MDAESLTQILTSLSQLTENTNNISQLLEVCQYILFGVSFVAGVLVGRGFSFWKW